MLIVYVGMTVIIDLINISLPAWLRDFVLHPFSLSRILSFKYISASLFYRLHTDGNSK